MEVLLMLVSVLLNRATLNSHNSSKPPSSDPNRKKNKRNRSDKPSGGQPGHVGKTLQKIADPDEIAVIKVDRSTLPKGGYKEVGFETRQVFDIDISRLVTEYQAQILENDQGQRFVATFPEGVTKAVQYGNQLKAHAVYLSQYQLLPYKRIQEYFADQLNVPLSEGSLYSFNHQAFTQLAEFEQLSKDQLARGVRVKLKTSSFQLHTRQTTLSRPTDVGKELYEQATPLLDQFPFDEPFRLVGLAAYDIVRPGDPLQMDLFGAPQGDRRRLEAAVDAVRDRFGDGAVSRAELLGRDAWNTPNLDFVPDRPEEEEEHWEEEPDWAADWDDDGDAWVEDPDGD